MKNNPDHCIDMDSLELYISDKYNEEQTADIISMYLIDLLNWK